MTTAEIATHIYTRRRESSFHKSRIKADFVCLHWIERSSCSPSEGIIVEMKTYSSPPHILFLSKSASSYTLNRAFSRFKLSPEPLPRAASWMESVSSWMKNDLFLFSSFFPRSHDNHSTVGSFGCCRTARYPEYTRVLCRRECHEWGRHRSINVQSDWRTESKVRNLLEFHADFSV